MDPDDIPTFPILDNLVRKCLIDFDVIDPRMVLVCLTLWIIWDLVVEYRPKNLLAVMRISPIEVAILAKNRQRVILSRYYRKNGSRSGFEVFSWATRRPYNGLLMKRVRRAAKSQRRTNRHESPTSGHRPGRRARVKNLPCYTPAPLRGNVCPGSNHPEKIEEP